MNWTLKIPGKRIHWLHLRDIASLEKTQLRFSFFSIHLTAKRPRFGGKFRGICIEKWKCDSSSTSCVLHIWSIKSSAVYLYLETHQLQNVNLPQIIGHRTCDLSRTFTVGARNRGRVCNRTLTQQIRLALHSLRTYDHTPPDLIGQPVCPITIIDHH